MKTVAISDLKAGMTINVHALRYEDETPMIRMLTRVTRTKKKDGEWIHFYWKPGTHPEGRTDCGYSGRRTDADGFTKREYAVIE